MNKRTTDEKHQDFIARVIQKSSPLGTTILVGLCAPDLLLQYAILTGGIGVSAIRIFSGTTLPLGPAVVTSTAIDGLVLSQYRLALLSMAVGSAFKQSLWAVYTSQEELPAVSAILISLYNSTLNSLNTLLFTCSQTSAASPGEILAQSRLLAGCNLYSLGLVAEAVAEIQRMRFKQNPENKEKVCDTGLFFLARHISHGAYSVWRAGFAIISSGWIFISVIGVYFLYDFASRGVPALNSYCQDRVSWVFGLRSHDDVPCRVKDAIVRTAVI